MPKTNIKCWSCGQNTMISFEELGHGWQKCSNCGATEIPNPTVSKHIRILEETWADGEGRRHYASTPVRKPKTQAK